MATALAKRKTSGKDGPQARRRAPVERAVPKGASLSKVAAPPPEATGEKPRNPARKLKRTIRILSAGAKGGVGKTFLCKNLAGAAISAGYSVAVVDFDRQRTLLKWVARRETHCHDRPAIASFGGDPKLLQDASEALTISDYDIVFYDTPPSLDETSEVLKTLAMAVDFILVPSGDGISDTESHEALLKALAKWGRPTMAVLNKVTRQARSQIATAKARLNRMVDLCPIEIGNYTDLKTVDEVGLGATEADNCRGADDIDFLWDAVARRLGIGD